MGQDKKSKIIIVTATGIALITIAGLLIYFIRKGKSAIGLDEIMAQLND